ncbi:hypothetical protein [Algoriphagus sediminis]|uniref:Uncharacterized protein n=1 Tax=Algoriphagus sediminis TaxID=3057113 RepID=A0ABT7YD52_9BACT|nr:hypothetical protein [Algoriphagus sediminis]MDN3204456.1 hypothetical protein [Algoriphagus sediminis]
MQHHWNFKNFRRADLENLKSFLEEKIGELETFLSYYYRGEGATVENLSITSIKAPGTEEKGLLNVNFKVAYFNLCWNIDDHDSDKMNIDIYFDEKGEALKLIGPDW